MKQIDWHIIRKVLDKTATEEELREYRRWLEVSDSHRAYMKDVERYRGVSPRVPEAQVQAYFREAMLRMQRRKRLHRLLSWSSAAALFCVAVGSIWLLRQVETDSLQETGGGTRTELFTDVVRLTTSDGKVYDLENKREETSAEEDVLPVEESTEMAAPQIIDVPRGKSWQLTLADSSRVYVNANSRLIFPENFDGQKERRVVLVYGEAYFQVAKDAGKPFIVSAGGTETEVYGTEFNVDSYEQECTKTTLVEGSVGMRLADGGQELRLQPGEQGRPDGRGGLVAEKADLEALTAWKDNLFFFRDTTLEEITQRLWDWYGVEFRFARKELKEERFYCRLPRTLPIETVLEALERGHRVRFVYHDGVVTVK